MKTSKTIKLMWTSFGVATIFMSSVIVLVAGDYVIREDDQMIQMNDDDGTPTIISVYRLGPNNLAATDVNTDQETARSVVRNVTFSGSPTPTPS